jgi:hypothetical protein
LQDGSLTEDAAKQLQLTESSFVNRIYILDMLQRMRELCKRNETCRLDFENAGSLSEIARRRLDFEMLKRVDSKLV